MQLGSQLSDSVVNTDQFSNEIRFASQLDGPVQFTLGALYWSETRTFEDRAMIIFCTLTRRQGPGVNETNIITDTRSFCDGNPLNPNAPISAGNPRSLDNWQDYYRQLQPQVASTWRAETESWSFYGQLEWKPDGRLDGDVRRPVRVRDLRFHQAQPERLHPVLRAATPASR